MDPEKGREEKQEKQEKQEKEQTGKGPNEQPDPMDEANAGKQNPENPVNPLRAFDEPVAGPSWRRDEDSQPHQRNHGQPIDLDDPDAGPFGPIANEDGQQHQSNQEQPIDIDHPNAGPFRPVANEDGQQHHRNQEQPIDVDHPDAGPFCPVANEDGQQHQRNQEQLINVDHPDAGPFVPIANEDGQQHQRNQEQPIDVDHPDAGPFGPIANEDGQQHQRNQEQPIEVDHPDAGPFGPIANEDGQQHQQNQEQPIDIDHPDAGPFGPMANEDGQQHQRNQEQPIDVDHPDAGPPVPESNEDKANRRWETLLALFPTVDPEFLHQKAVEFGFSEESEVMLIGWIDQNIDEGHRGFPTRVEYEGRVKEHELLDKYSDHLTVEGIMEMYQDPVAHFNDPTRQVSSLYKEHSLYQLKLNFRYVPLTMIRQVHSQNNGLFIPSIKALRVKQRENIHLLRRTRRQNQECPAPAKIDLNFLKELGYSRIEEEVKLHMRQVEQKKQDRIKKDRAECNLVECNCCANEECFREDMFACRGGHAFCRECLQRASEVAMGEGVTQLSCLGDCKETFELATLQKALNAVLFSKWLKVIQLAEMEKADIEGLVQCPFCPFATIMDTVPEANKLFSCQNPDCGKESCRLCRQLSHIPYKCDDMTEKDAEVRKRTYIENKMSEALIRTCWSCQKPFVKVYGCNKMTCKCGAKMCYLCRQPVKDYSHFYGQGGVRTTTRKCPLFTNNAEVHQRDVAEEAIKAKDEVDRENPEVKLRFDPTAGIQMPKQQPENQRPADLIIAPRPVLEQGVTENQAVQGVIENPPRNNQDHDQNNPLEAAGLLYHHNNRLHHYRHRRRHYFRRRF